jgi:hypothetical protein
VSANFLRIEGVAWSAQRIPTAVNFGFLDRSRYFSFKLLLIYPHEAEWSPFHTHYFSENLVAPGIEPGTSGSVARNSDHFSTNSVCSSKKHLLDALHLLLLFNGTRTCLEPELFLLFIFYNGTLLAFKILIVFKTILCLYTYVYFSRCIMATVITLIEFSLLSKR